MHWAVFMRPVVWLFLALWTSHAGIGELSTMFFWIAFIDAIGRYMLWSNTRYTLTTRRLVMATGIYRKRSLDMSLSKVESIVVDEPWFGRICGDGTVVVGGTGGTKEVFPLVPQPQNFRTEVQERLAA